MNAWMHIVRKNAQEEKDNFLNWKNKSSVSCFDGINKQIEEQKNMKGIRSLE